MTLPAPSVLDVAHELSSAPGGPGAARACDVISTAMAASVTTTEDTYFDVIVLQVWYDGALDYANASVDCLQQWVLDFMLIEKNGVKKNFDTSHG